MVFMASFFALSRDHLNQKKLDNFTSLLLLELYLALVGDCLGFQYEVGTVWNRLE